MFRVCLILCLTTAPLLAQTATEPIHHKTSVAVTGDQKWLHEVDALQNRARQILNAELSRKPGPACDYSQLYAKLSNAEFTRCVATDEVITEHNYQAFVDTLSASLSILPPDEDPKIFPLPSRNFATAEAAWRTYLDKICAAMGDTYGAGTGASAAMSECQQSLTRQHMKDLNEIFLKSSSEALR